MSDYESSTAMRVMMLGIAICGGWVWVHFGELNARTATNTVPAGKYMQTHIVEQQTSGTAVGFTTQGPALGVVASGNDRSLVETDKATYQVEGLFTAGKGDELEVRTMVDRTKKLCIHGAERCFLLLE